MAVGPGGHDVTSTHQHTIGIDIGKERQPVIAGHKLWLLSVCRGCQTGSQHQTGEADPDLSHDISYLYRALLPGLSPQIDQKASLQASAPPVPPEFSRPGQQHMCAALEGKP